jgi:hypothetical protein
VSGPRHSNTSLFQGGAELMCRLTYRGFDFGKEMERIEHHQRAAITTDRGELN